MNGFKAIRNCFDWWIGPFRSGPKDGYVRSRLWMINVTLRALPVFLLVLGLEWLVQHV